MAYLAQTGDLNAVTVYFHANLTATTAVVAYRPDGQGHYDKQPDSASQQTPVSWANELQFARDSFGQGQMVHGSTPWSHLPIGPALITWDGIEAVRYLVASGEYSLAQADALLAPGRYLTFAFPASFLSELPDRLSNVSESFFTKTMVDANVALHKPIGGVDDSALMNSLSAGAAMPWAIPAGKSSAQAAAASWAQGLPELIELPISSRPSYAYNEFEMARAINQTNAGTGLPYLTANYISWLTDPVTDPVVKAYLAYFGRPADVGGLLYTGNIIKTYGGNTSAVGLSFAPSAESQSLYNGTTTDQKVSAVYHQLFGRDPDASGLQYWVGVLDSGQLTQTDMALTILNGAQGTDLSIIDNKVLASRYWTQFVPMPDYMGLQAASNGRAYLSSIGADATVLPKALSAAQNTTLQGRVNHDDIRTDLALVGLAVGDYFHG